MSELTKDIEDMTHEEARAYLHPLLEQDDKNADVWKALGALSLREGSMEWSRQCFAKYFQYSGETKLEL